MSEKELILLKCKQIRSIAEKGYINSKKINNTVFFNLMNYFDIKIDIDIISYFQVFLSHIQPYMLFVDKNFTDEVHFYSYIVDIYRISFHIEEDNLLVIDNIDMDEIKQYTYDEKEIEILKDEKSIVENHVIKFFIPKGFSVFEINAEYKDVINDEIFIIDYQDIKKDEQNFATVYMNTFSEMQNSTDITRIETIINRIPNEKNKKRRIIQDIVLSTLIESSSIKKDILKKIYMPILEKYKDSHKEYINRVYQLLQTKF